MKNIKLYIMVASALLHYSAHGEETVSSRLNGLKITWLAARQKAVVPVDEKYHEQLKKLMESYTKAGQLDNALAVKGEIEMISAGDAKTGRTETSSKSEAVEENVFKNKTFSLYINKELNGTLSFHDDGKVSGFWENTYHAEGDTVTLTSPDTRYKTIFRKRGEKYIGERAADSQVRDGVAFELILKK